MQNKDCIYFVKFAKSFEDYSGTTQIKLEIEDRAMTFINKKHAADETTALRDSLADHKHLNVHVL